MSENIDALVETPKVRILLRAITAFALAMLVLSCVPFFVLAPYSRTAVDDFVYGIPVYYTLQAGKGFFGVLGAIWENIRYTYMDWQGTFSSVVLFSLEPGVFSDEAYGATTYVVLAVIILPIFLALRTVRGIDKRGVLFLGGIIAFFSVQYLPSPAQAIFWWNGAAHYQAFWCLAVWTVTRQIKLSRREPAGWRFYAAAAVNCLLGFCVGGGNYCTALVFAMVSACLTVYAFFQCRRAVPVRYHAAAAHVLTTIFSLAGLFISVIAPGNAVRQAAFEPMTPVAAIMLSFQQASRTLLGMLDWKLLGALLLCVSVFLFATRKSDLQFRWPLLILVGSFCAFAALYTPPYYAMNVHILAPRLQNLMWQAGVFVLFGNAFYLSGWVVRRLSLLERKYSWHTMAVLFAAGGVLFACAVLIQFRTSNAYMAYFDLKSPAVETYVQEREERKRIYEDKSIQSPRFQHLSDPPQSFYAIWTATWASDLLVDGVPVSLPLYHGQGGEATYVKLQDGLEFFGMEKPLTPSDFSKYFHVRGGDYVPFRELCELLGYQIEYATFNDTITVTTR